MAERQATFVATSSPAGQELLGQARQVAARHGFALTELTNPGQRDVAVAIGRSDAVILDATIEAGGGSNYPGFTAQPQVMDHVLVVSRTPLPLNFHGLREGGAPPYPWNANNDTLLTWLDVQLTELRSVPRRSGWNGRWPARS